MKLSHVIEDSRVRVTMSEEVRESECHCLEHFWERFVDVPCDEVYIDMNQVDEIDSEGETVLINQFRKSLERGARITIEGAPQSLAHNLYKTEMLAPPARIELVRPRIPEEEPYAG